MSRATVQTIIRNYETNGSVENKPRSGRPKKLSRRDIRYILKEVKKNPKVSATKLSEDIVNISSKCVHPRTIERTLNKYEYSSCVCRKKPLISDINRKRRLDFAKDHINEGTDFWRKVLFSDECMYNIIECNARCRVWRKKNTAMQPQNLTSTVKHGGGSVMVWGAVAASGVGNLAFIEGIMNRFQYKAILEQNLKQSADKLNLGSDWMFQQDNDPKHTAYIVKEWLLYHVPHQLETPPQSPDLNIIEHVWEIVRRKLRKFKVSNAAELKKRILEAWETISANELTNLVDSMPRRLQAVIDADGGPTKY